MLWVLNFAIRKKITFCGYLIHSALEYFEKLTLKNPQNPNFKRYISKIAQIQSQNWNFLKVHQNILFTFLRVPSLTKVEVSNFFLLNFFRWLCLIHGQLAMSLRHLKRSALCKCQSFCLSDIQIGSVLS